MRILAISGSLRGGSHNTRLLRLAAERAPAGVQVELWDGLRSIPPYDEDEDAGRAPAAVVRMREAIANADALLLATPEYNSSIPGVLKNAIDWASRPRADAALAGKPAAVVGATTGSFGAVWAQAELRKVLASAGARVLDAELALPRAHQAFDADGKPHDPGVCERLDTALAGLVAEVERDRTPIAA